MPFSSVAVQSRLVAAKKLSIEVYVAISSRFTTYQDTKRTYLLLIIRELLILLQLLHVATNTEGVDCYYHSIAALMIETLLRDTGMLSWLCLMMSCMLPDFETICSTWARFTRKARWQRTIIG